MHEMSIAISLIEQIEKQAFANNLMRVDEIEIETGMLRQVIPEVMQEAFKVASEETIANGAILNIIEVKPLVKCRQCKNEYEPTLNDFLCPQCKLADVDIIIGNEIILKSITGNNESE